MPGIEAGLVLAAALLAPELAAQAPPTDIYLVPVARDSPATIGEPRNLTARPGYDNQPSFTADGDALYYTSIRDDGQADTYRFDLAEGTTTRVTFTADESEYSPTLLADGRHISVVKVERDSAQRVWRFDLTGDNPQMVVGHARPIGYYAWGNPHTLAVFLLGDTASLQLLDLRTEAAYLIADDVGRTILKVPARNAISFLHQTDTGRLIREVDLDTHAIRSIAPALDESEFFTWTPDASLLMGRGTSVFRWDAAANRWQQLADLAAFGIQGITRLAVSPSGGLLAIVAQDGAEGTR